MKPTTKKTEAKRAELSKLILDAEDNNLELSVKKSKLKTISLQIANSKEIISRENSKLARTILGIRTDEEVIQQSKKHLECRESTLSDLLEQYRNYELLAEEILEMKYIDTTELEKKLAGLK